MKKNFWGKTKPKGDKYPGGLGFAEIMIRNLGYKSYEEYRRGLKK